jgi:hypothetical protein
VTFVITHTEVGEVEERTEIRAGSAKFVRADVPILILVFSHRRPSPHETAREESASDVLY